MTDFIFVNTFWQLHCNLRIQQIIYYENSLLKTSNNENSFENIFLQYNKYNSAPRAMMNIFVIDNDGVEILCGTNGEAKMRYQNI